MIVLACVLGGRSVSRDRTLWTSAALALASVFGIYPRPDLVHIAFSLPLSLPLSAYCLAVFVGRGPRVLIYLVTALVILFYLPDAFNSTRDAKQALHAKLTHMSRGDVALREDGAADLVDQLNYQRSGTYFFYPYMPMLPYLMAKKQVSMYDVFVPYYTTAEQYRQACEEVMQRASLIVMNTRWNDQVFLLRVFPAMKVKKDKTKRSSMRRYVLRFKPIWESGQFQILRRTSENARKSLLEVARDSVIVEIRGLQSLVQCPPLLEGSSSGDCASAPADNQYSGKNQDNSDPLGGRNRLGEDNSRGQNDGDELGCHIGLGYV